MQYSKITNISLIDFGSASDPAVHRPGAARLCNGLRLRSDIAVPGATAAWIATAGLVLAITFACVIVMFRPCAKNGNRVALKSTVIALMAEAGELTNRCHSAGNWCRRLKSRSKGCPLAAP